MPSHSYQTLEKAVLTFDIKTTYHQLSQVSHGKVELNELII